MMMTFDDGDCGDFWIDQHNILCNVYGEWNENIRGNAMNA